MIQSALLYKSDLSRRPQVESGLRATCNGDVPAGAKIGLAFV
jgi:hypothetical protein